MNLLLACRRLCPTQYRLAICRESLPLVVALGFKHLNSSQSFFKNIFMQKSLTAVLLWFKYEMSPQAHVLKPRFPAGGTILGDSGNFRRWGLSWMK
jgi:hypothetical protein